MESLLSQLRQRKIDLLYNKTDQYTIIIVCSIIELLPIELIVNEIAHWLFEVDKQLLRCVNKKFNDFFPYKKIKFNETEIELVHLIKYKKLWNDQTLQFLAQNGYLDCLKYANKNGYYKLYRYDTLCTLYASMNGHLDCLKYAHENTYLWDKKTTMFTAKNGHLDCLKYVHENGCPWDQDTARYAAENGHLDCAESVCS